MFKANYHTHTRFCDGQNTAEEVAAFAAEHKFTHLGFSGHMDPDIHMDFPSYIAEITRLKSIYGRTSAEPEKPDILTGVELDILYEKLRRPESALPDQESILSSVEYVIGSTHFLDIESAAPMSVDSDPESIRFICEQFYSGDYYRMSKAYYDLESQVADRLHCTFIGHFDLITRFNDDLHFLDENDPRYLTPALEAMEHLVKKGVPFEINCGAVNRGRKKELYPSFPLLRALHEFGGEIIISSDAHQKELLTGAFETAKEAAAACGFTHTNILEHDPSGKVVWKQIPLDALEY